MGLSNDLISQFVKITNDEKKDKKESTVYGTIVTYNDADYVRLDGSDLLTPVVSTTEVVNGERVTVMIKDHTATVMGNITNPSASVATTTKLGNDIIQQGNTITQINNNITQQNNNITQMGNTITQQNNSISQMGNTITQHGNSITQIGNKVDQQGSTITTLESTVNTQGSTITTLDSTVKTHGSSIETLDSTVKTQGSSIDIYNSSFQVTDGIVTGIKGVDTDWIVVKDLEADHATIANLDSKYANIDFTNIGKATFEYFYSQSGLIENVVVGDQTITGELVGVTIRGDRIIGDTIIADKLVIKGEDGLFYKLNTNGVTVEKEQTSENSLNGQVILAKSITATKIDVKDLVAFNATIGGFKITDNSIYSGVKETVNNTTRGIYLDNDGQIAFGDASNYIKFYKVDDTYKLDISADSVTIGSSKKNVEETVVSVRIEYALSNTTTDAPTSGWSETAPNWVSGKYMWQRSVTTLINGEIEYGDPTCISGATGQQGPKGDTGATGATGSQGPKGDKGDTGSQGPQGIQGPKGDTGATGAQGPTGATGVGVKSITNYYLATNSSSGITTGTSGWTPTVQNVSSSKKYLWNYELITYTNNSTSTTTPCIIGAYGDTGAQGPQGETGSTGATGAAGNGISSITEYYAVSSSNSTAPTSWKTTLQTMTSTNKYLWNYELITYTNGTTKETLKRVIGVYGDTGAQGATGATGPQGPKGDTGATGSTGPQGPQGPQGAAGKGIKSAAVTYQASSSGTTTPTGTWSSTIPSVSASQYLWTRTIITYTDNATSTFYSVGMMGATGAQGPQGAAGKGIKSTAVTYQVGTSATTAPTGTWSSSIVATTTGKYLWTRTIITYTDNTTTTSYSISAHGATGSQGATGPQGPTGATGPQGPTGATGNGISSVTRQYYLSTSKTSQSGSSWTTTAPSWSNNKYLWIRDAITYTNGTTVYTTPYCDNSWEAVNNVESQILAWCYNNDTTWFDGANIYANTITANKLATDAIKSVNYVKNSTGSFLNLADGSFDSKYLKWTKDGALTSTSGTIGGITISDTGLHASNTDSNGITNSYHIYKDAAINLMQTGSGVDHMLLLFPNVLNLQSKGTVSGTNPSNVTLTSTYLQFSQLESIVGLISASTDGKLSITGTQGIILKNSTTINGALSTTGAISSSSSITSASALISNSGAIELFGATPYIDFHYGSSTADYNVRLINNATGVLTCTGSFYSNSGTNVIGYQRFNNEWVGFYPSVADAKANTSRKGYIGHDGSNSFYIKNEKAGIMNLVTGTNIQFNNQYGVWHLQNGFRPSSDLNNKYPLGYDGARWSVVYAGTGTINTSDRNQKKDFTEFDERYENLFFDLKPQLFKFKDGTSDRFHSGYISQDVEESLLKYGLTALDFAGFCKDQKKVVKEVTEDGEEVMEEVFDEDGNPVYNYSLRYSEFIALNTHMIQKQQKEISELKTTVESQQKQIEELTNLVKQLLNKGAQ